LLGTVTGFAHLYQPLAQASMLSFTSSLTSKQIQSYQDCQAGLSVHEISPLSFWFSITLAAIALVMGVVTYLQLVEIPYMKLTVILNTDNVNVDNGDNGNGSDIDERKSLNGDAEAGNGNGRDHTTAASAAAGVASDNEKGHITVASYAKWLYYRYNLGGPFIVIGWITRSCNGCRKFDCSRILPQLNTSSPLLEATLDDNRRWPWLCWKSVSYSRLRTASIVFTLISAATLTWNIIQFQIHYNFIKENCLLYR
jgi:hypothetical protein